MFIVKLYEFSKISIKIYKLAVLLKSFISKRSREKESLQGTENNSK